MSFNNECPFCEEVGFDLIGLKCHLKHCESFKTVPDHKTFYSYVGAPCSGGDGYASCAEDSNGVCRQCGKIVDEGKAVAALYQLEIAVKSASKRAASFADALRPAWEAGFEISKKHGVDIGEMQKQRLWDIFLRTFDASKAEAEFPDVIGFPPSKPMTLAEAKAEVLFRLIEQNMWSVQYNSYHQSWTVQRHVQVVGSIGRGKTLSEAVAQAAAHQNEETAPNL